MQDPRFLILETSTGAAQVALAQGSCLLERQILEESRRHARELVPAVQELLRTQNWKPNDIDGVLVNRGPGSYTGLRVGIMSAKTFAYATGCALIAGDTMATLAVLAPAEVESLDVFVDAQQDRVYWQRFARVNQDWTPQTELAIVPFLDWLNQENKVAWITGPGLRGKEARFPPEIKVVDSSLWSPQAEGLLQTGLSRFQRGQRDDLWTLEPLYLRPSAAEQQWEGRP